MLFMCIHMVKQELMATCQFWLPAHCNLEATLTKTTAIFIAGVTDTSIIQVYLFAYDQHSPN